MLHLGRIGTLLTVLMLATPAFAAPEDEKDRRIRKLEETVSTLVEEIRELKGEDGTEVREMEPSELEERIRILEQKSEATGRLKLGGYGKSHLNFGEGSTGDYVDHHRFVLYIGYDFADWIRLHSETEIEHAFVADDAGGEISIEQLHTDFLLCDGFNVRFGRVLTPIGITNQKHEPPAFNGVERPFFDKVILPSTWSADGVGAFGAVNEEIDYEIYLVAGMDGAGFSATSGIRGGRIKERPGLSHPAVTGRVDYYPFATADVTQGQTLRVGLSGYYGGIDNGNKGSDPGVGDTLTIISGDFEYTIADFDFRGAIARESIGGAKEISGGVASTIFGWYLEGAVHLLPDSMKTGKLEAADLVFFVRYEDFDTQYRMPSGVRDDPAGDRTAITVGFTFFLRPNLVFKTDYQILDDQTGDSIDNLFNVGLGWQF